MKRFFAFVFLLIWASLIFTCSSAGNDTIYIDKKTISALLPKIKDWLDYYNLDIRKFKPDGSSGIYIPQEYEESIFCAQLPASDLMYKPKLREYSPDKNYCIPLYEFIAQYDEETGLYYGGWDDSQSVWLYDKSKKLGSVIQFNGVGSITEAAYWLDNNTFVLLGYECVDNYKFTLRLCNLQTEDAVHYSLEKEQPEEGKSYYTFVLAKRGIEIIE
ncbi:hypothetical protein [Dysgonomonas sp. 25]|uniref:hypothetical protein n=1 Tax=Dysgonomonas sp. 25 TaxID=2302933 RepID=UPI0013D4E64F|nr:hypothetical protein [Dysgonomonas sp. 25]NDV68190.1 hypothetical protein [Dysgonomonas sp. 25]